MGRAKRRASFARTSASRLYSQFPPHSTAHGRGERKLALAKFRAVESHLKSQSRQIPVHDRSTVLQVEDRKSLRGLTDDDGASIRADLPSSHCHGVLGCGGVSLATDFSPRTGRRRLPSFARLSNRLHPHSAHNESPGRSGNHFLPGHFDRRRSRHLLEASRLRVDCGSRRHCCSLGLPAWRRRRHCRP